MSVKNIEDTYQLSPMQQGMLFNKFSCFIIGVESHLVQCAEILLQRGHQICGIVSSETLITNWAKQKGIPHIEPGPDLASVLSRQPFDYFFSIVNPYIIPNEILALPRKGAINFHDGPLPRYAGVHATSWALINQEKTHGVTWHIMSAEVDKGDILKQRFVDIVEGDTAFTLNVKCYEAGIHSFAELVDELASGRVELRKQNLAEQTYFSKYKRPPAACTLSWSQPADEIAALVRALDFGPYTNPLGLPKLVMGNEVFIVPEIEVLDANSQVGPGTITAIDDDALKVATASNEVALGKLLTINGQPLSVTDFVARFGVREGDRLAELDQETADHLTTLNSAICRHEAFWVNRLAHSEPIELPYPNHSLAPTSPVQYATVPMSIPAEVNTLLARHDDVASRSDFLAAAFAAYLARLSSNYTFDLGFSHPALQQEVVGFECFFATHVPLRAELDPSARFGAALDVLQAQLALVKKHKTYARDTILRYPELGSLRAHGDQSPWSVIVELVECLDDYTPLPGSELTLLLSEDGPDCRWVHDTAVLDKESIASMQRQFATFLQNVVADSNCPVAENSLLTEAEYHQLMIEWNNTQGDYPQHLCIHQLFEAQVERTPHAVAVVFKDQQLSYHELNMRANQVAHYLRERGVGPEMLVGICVERSLEMVVGLLGILKAGGAYVPLDPAYPKERLAFILEDGQVPVLLTQERLLPNLPEHTAEVVYLDTDREDIAQESAEIPGSEVMGENLAYVIYTSGSTGKPNGVLISHGAIANHCRDIQRYYQLTPDDRVLQFASLSFDASLEQILPTLIAGARLVLRDAEVWAPQDFYQKISDFGLTVINLPPGYWHQVAQEWANAPERVLAQRLRLAIIGGDVMQPESVHLWRQTPMTAVRLLNAYGPTEATITATTFEVSLLADEALSFRGIPIGRPIANKRTYILDSHLQPVPVGVTGELYLGGAGLARGYLNRPKLTAERFIPDPFSEEPRARLYKTGDLARYLSDGNIEFLGRIDHQVKFRGFRIELGEIETVLGQHPAVRETVAIVREDHPGNKRLVAYIVPKESDRIELWPSLGEFFIYDDLLYYAMTNDKRRNNSYKVAINGLVKDKAVVDIGTGKDALLARFCVEAGARKVYAIEVLEEPYEQAKACIKNLGLEDKIVLIHGDSTKAQLPEEVDVCVSRIVGPIGGAEAAGYILNDARRFLKQDGVMIPERSITRIAAVCLPDGFLADPAFTEVTGHYVEQIFEQVGYKFDLRLCLKGMTKSSLISNIEVFEDLDFTDYVSPEYSREVNFTITQDSRSDGFLVWLNLYTIEDEMIDILEHEYNWLPVYFPVFHPGIEVSKGDTIKAVVSGAPCENNPNPDYKMKGNLIKQNGDVIHFEWDSYHYERTYKATPFYRLLFAEDSIRVRKSSRAQLSSKELRAYLKGYLPDYMVPSAFMLLDALPLTPSGKVDRRALPAPHDLRPDLEATYVAPRTEVERTIAIVWQEVLNLKNVGIHDNFFDLGGHSLLMAQVQSKLRQVFDRDISIVEMFQYPTIGSLSKYLSHEQNEPPSFQKIHDRAKRQKEAINRQKQLAEQRRRSK